MRTGPRTVGLAGALTLIVVTNVLVLAGALWNRSGGPVSELLLTERELPLPDILDPEDPLVALPLTLAHQVPDWERQVREFRLGSVSRALPWLDRAKLGELGFDVRLDPADPEAPGRYGRMLRRVVHVALEIDGPGWRAWMEEQERTAETEADRTVVELGRSLRSRLYAVDASLDAKALRRSYPDRRRYAVARALVGTDVEQPVGRPARLVGTLHLENPFVFLPPPARRSIAPFRPTLTSVEFLERRARRTLPPPVAREPRYAASVAFGRRQEPWIRGVQVD